MDPIEQIREYIHTRPEMAKRVGIVLVLLLVGVPGGLWFYFSTEEKAYQAFTSGYYSFRNRAYNQATGAFTQLVTMHPNSKYAPMGLYYLALTHLASNNLDEAAGKLNMFVAENPKHFLCERAYAIWMAIELSAGRPESAVSLADRYLSQFGESSLSRPEVLYRKGVALLQLGRGDEARKSFEEASAFKEKNIFGNLAFYAHTSTRPQL